MKHSMWNGISFSILVLVVATTWPSVASAGSCQSGNLSNFIGTTCSVGSLQFAFTGLSTANYSYNYGTGTYTYGAAWTASDFTFTRASKGFSLSFNGGPQSITSSAGGYTLEDIILYYTVTESNGKIKGETATGSGLSASPRGIGDPTPQASATIDGNAQYSTSSVVGYTYIANGVTMIGQSSDGPPFATGSGLVSIELFGYYGGSAGWNGTPATYAFEATPEPSSILLFGTSILGLVPFRRKLFGR